MPPVTAPARMIPAKPRAPLWANTPPKAWAAPPPAEAAPPPAATLPADAADTPAALSTAVVVPAAAAPPPIDPETVLPNAVVPAAAVMPAAVPAAPARTVWASAWDAEAFRPPNRASFCKKYSKNGTAP